MRNTSVYCLLAGRLICAAVLIGLVLPGTTAQAQLLTGYEESEAPPAQVEAQQSAPVVQESQGWRPVLSPYDEAPPRAAPVLTQTEAPRSAPVLTQAAPAGEPSQGFEPSDAPVDLQADSLQHDEQTRTITASGNVMMVQAGRILRADQISYNLQTDKVVATGHVVLNEINGDIHYAERVELEQELKNGFVQGLESYLADGSRFWADEGRRTDGNTTTMEDAAYTPCAPCEDNPDRAPVWQIRAAEVEHDEQEARISYEHAWFEIFGVPVVYTPYFSHPDGSIDRKSGLVAPLAGYKSDLGAFLGSSYYWNVAPDKDMTVGLIAMTDEAPLAHAEWRQRWDNASIELQGGITYSGRTEKKAGEDVEQDEEMRGHVLAGGLWNMNDKWRSGFDIEWVSDDQYIRQYDFDEFDFSDDDVLESEIYAERFSGRSYAVGRLLAFQDIRIREEQEDQPEVLPEIIASFKGEPGAVPVFKGSWSIDTSFLGLQRGGDDQDMNRFSVQAGWKRRLVSDYGLLTNVEASIRGDAYNTRDRDVATPGSGQDDSNTETRFFPNLHVQSSYPVVRAFETMQATIEPVVALTIAPNIDVNNDIPNEDSQDVQIDASNLFEANRFPGLDRIEDKTKVTYGLRTGLYGYDGSHGDIFLGQSYRLDDDDNPFPEGSGLDQQSSDVVGQISAVYKGDHSLDYRFQLASDNLSSQRHEVDAFSRWNRFELTGRYLFAKALEGTDIDESREQIRGSAAYYVSEDWRVRTGATQDLGAQSGLRRAYVGLDYFGQCISLSLTGQRNLTDDATGDSDTEIIFRIGLKNLGEFAASGLRVDSTSE